MHVSQTKFCWSFTHGGKKILVFSEETSDNPNTSLIRCEGFKLPQFFNVK